jgi:hypothetical protein
MSLELWKQHGWLREYKTSAQEVNSLMELVERDLTDAAREEISKDWRFNIAYNSGLQLRTIVLYAAGYRAGRGERKHYRVIQALSLVMGPGFSTMRDYLDNCRRKRNISEYDAIDTISAKEAEDLLQTVQELKADVESWLRKNHPEIYKPR